MSAPKVVEVTGSAEVTPDLLASMFWELDSTQQADFFAALDELAGIRLCFQMAAVVREIQERNDRGDHSAQKGFQTMLSHAQEFAEGATDYRVWAAQQEIRRLSNEARDRIGAQS